MNNIHSCSYYCNNPPCIKQQRDEMRAVIDALTAKLKHAEFINATLERATNKLGEKLAKVERACRDALEIIKDDGHTAADDQAIVVLEEALRGEHE